MHYDGAYLYRVVYIELFSSFSLGGFHAEALYWLSLWDFKEESISHFLWHAQKENASRYYDRVFASIKIHSRECLVDIEKAVKKDFLRPESLAVILG